MVFLGPIPKPGQPVFRNYTELPRRVPISAWHVIRVISVLAYLALVVGLFVRPAGALFAFFKIVVPLLPILFFTAPGLWRNLCPLAAANQAPRVLRFTRGFTPPAWLRRYGLVVAIVLFFGITSARIVLFNVSGQATGILLAVTIVNAFVAGLFFKGKSGWCSSMCPLLPLQRVYGQTPFLTVPNSHCQPCVGCTKNCYDFKPQVAYQADMHDADHGWVSPRKLFAAALPGFVLGFFTLLVRERDPGRLVPHRDRGGHPVGPLADPGHRAGPHHRLDHPHLRRGAPVRRGGFWPPRRPGPGGPPDGQRPASFDRSILSVVVVGNGIAGVTAADFVRRGHPDCEIHLVGRETHVLYNRMGISRLVYGRSAMQGLYLLAEPWYDEHGITAWLNTFATEIDLANRRVRLGTGDPLFYDRLILAMGSSSTVPAIERIEMPGSFVMREAADAMAIRGYVQQHGARIAVVAGAGLLGLEAAYALYELGLQVTVLERGGRLLAKQVDARCSELVQGHFDELGIAIRYRAEAASLHGEGRVSSLQLKDGTSLPCDVFLGAVGIRPNVDLAAAGGLAVNRGILVDDRMQTSVPGVFAAGDVAEHNGMVLGLWPIAAKQAEVAAVNALGGDESLIADVPGPSSRVSGLSCRPSAGPSPSPGRRSSSSRTPASVRTAGWFWPTGA